MESWQFGYIKDGNFYRKTVEGTSNQDALDKFNAERPDVEIVAAVRVA